MSLCERAWTPRSDPCYPTRVCLAGEDLDWLGGHSVCVAVDLWTTVSTREIGPAIPVDPYITAIRNVLIDHRRIDVATEFPRLHFRSDAPPGSGISTSTSMTLAALAALRTRLQFLANNRQLIELAYESEYRVTGGGGMDHVSIAYGGAILTAGVTRGLPPIVRQAPWPDVWSITLIHSGDAKNSSSHLSQLRERNTAKDPLLTSYLRGANRLALEVWDAIADKSLSRLGSAVNEAHALMRDAQGMSTPRLESLREAALQSGFSGAKITGSGHGGMIVAVGSRETRAACLSALFERANGAGIYPVDAIPPLSPGRLNDEEIA